MKPTYAALAAVSISIVGFAAWNGWMADQSAQRDASWIAPSQGQVLLEGKRLYDTYCASCHGADLKGQSNWRKRLPNGRLPAPPHDVSGHTWHHPDSQLMYMIKQGFVGGINAPVGYQSDMPAFGSILTDSQIALILGYIKSHWDDRSLSAQKEITLNAR